MEAISDIILWFFGITRKRVYREDIPRNGGTRLNNILTFPKEGIHSPDKTCRYIDLYFFRDCLSVFRPYHTIHYDNGDVGQWTVMEAGEVHDTSDYPNCDTERCLESFKWVMEFHLNHRLKLKRFNKTLRLNTDKVLARNGMSSLI